MRVLRKRQRAAAQRSPLKKKDSYSCRNCFPDFSRAELEWLNHFRSRGRHSVDWRGVPFVQRREGRRAFFCWIAACAPSFVWQWPVSALFMWVRQHVGETAYAAAKKPLCNYDASAMKFQLFFCRLPNPPLTTPTKPRHTPSVRRCPFFAFFFVGFLTAANQRVPKKISPQWNDLWVDSAERSRSDRVGVEPGRERNGNVMWQSHITAVAVSHCSCFFPALFSELLNTMVFNLSHYLTIRK